MQIVRIDAVRRDGCALAEGEWMEGVNAVAAAVRGGAATS
jgi:DNA-binding IclR family transcriptional regulator